MVGVPHRELSSPPSPRELLAPVGVRLGTPGVERRTSSRLLCSYHSTVL